MRPRKNIRFTGAKVERREALSIPGAKRSRNGRGSEHGALLFFAPRGAAQAGLTEGAERSSKIRHETNVKWKRSAGRLHLELGGTLRPREKNRAPFGGSLIGSIDCRWCEAEGRDRGGTAGC